VGASGGLLYHFDQFDSHASQALVFCRKSVLVTRHQGLCRIDPMCDKAEKGRNTKIQPRFRQFRQVFAFLPLAAFGRPDSPQNASKTARSGLTECRKFYFITVTGRLCRSVELIQCVTVTGECRIDQNGTVSSLIKFYYTYTVNNCGI
jgi:hypothetical protein